MMALSWVSDGKFEEADSKSNSLGASQLQI